MRELVGHDAGGGSQRNKASRWIAHAEVRDLARAAASGANTSALAGVLGQADPRLTQVAEAFMTLHAERQRADYDHDYDIKRRDALLLIATARSAVELSRQLADQNEPSYRRFLRLMVAVRIARNR